METATAANSAADRAGADHRLLAGHRLRELAANLDLHRGFADVVASLSAGHGGTLGGVWGLRARLWRRRWPGVVLVLLLLSHRIRPRSMRSRAILPCSPMQRLPSFRRGKPSRASAWCMMRFMGSG